MRLIKLFFFSLFFSRALLSSEPVGVISFIHGNVLLNTKPASDGDEIFKNSRIQTKEGSCSLLMGETTVVQIGSNATVEVSQYLKQKESAESIELKLAVGEVKALVGSTPKRNKSFRVRTRSNVMGVRGTEIFVSAPENPAEPPTFVTLRGSAEITTLTAEGGSQKPGAGDSGAGGVPVPGGSPAGAPGIAPIILTANQEFRPGETVTMLPPERISEINNRLGPNPPGINPGAPPPMGPRPGMQPMPMPFDPRFGIPLAPIDPTDPKLSRGKLTITFAPD